jgi:hypothetical protein
MAFSLVAQHSFFQVRHFGEELCVFSQNFVKVPINQNLGTLLRNPKKRLSQKSQFFPRTEPQVHYDTNSAILFTTPLNFCKFSNEIISKLFADWMT